MNKTAGRVSVTHELLSGKSVLRALANRALAGWSDDVKGIVVDLASGTHASYRRIWQEAKVTRWISIDIDPAHQTSVVADLLEQLPLCDDAFDTAILSWFLYMAPDPTQVLREIARIVRPGGTLVITAPLVFPNVPEPADYWRFTDQGLRLLLERSGFRVVEVAPLGAPWSAAAYLISPYLRPRRLLGPLAAMTGLLLDRVARRLSKSRAPRCPIGYCVKAQVCEP